MTVRDVMDCCTSPVWITFDEDSRNGEIVVKIEDTLDALDILTDWVLDHEVHLMHCQHERLIISLFTADDAKEDNKNGR